MKKLLPLFLLLLIVAVVNNAQMATVIAENANLRGTPSGTGKVVDTLAAGTDLEIIKQKGVWFLVQTEDFVGWMHGDTIRYSASRPKAVLQDVRIFDEPETYSPPPSRRSASRTYIRGPRGGCYYINGNGNKTYVDRSLCN